MMLPFWAATSTASTWTPIHRHGFPGSYMARHTPLHRTYQHAVMAACAANEHSEPAGMNPWFTRLQSEIREAFASVYDHNTELC